MMLRCSRAWKVGGSSKGRCCWWARAKREICSFPCLSSLQQGEEWVKSGRGSTTGGRWLGGEHGALKTTSAGFGDDLRLLPFWVMTVMARPPWGIVWPDKGCDKGVAATNMASAFCLGHYTQWCDQPARTGGGYGSSGETQLWASEDDLGTRECSILHFDLGADVALKKKIQFLPQCWWSKDINLQLRCTGSNVSCHGVLVW